MMSRSSPARKGKMTPNKPRQPRLAGSLRHEASATDTPDTTRDLLSMSANDTTTPRGQIMTILSHGAVEHTAKRHDVIRPLTRTPRRRSQRRSLTQQAMLNTIIDNSTATEETPRNQIQNILTQGIEETPVSFAGDPRLPEEPVNQANKSMFDPEDVSIDEGSFLKLTQPVHVEPLSQHLSSKGHRSNIHPSAGHNIVKPVLKDFSINLSRLNERDSTSVSPPMAETRSETSINEDSFLQFSQPDHALRPPPPKRQRQQPSAVNFAEELRKQRFPVSEEPSEIDDEVLAKQLQSDESRSRLRERKTSETISTSPLRDTSKRRSPSKPRRTTPRSSPRRVSLARSSPRRTPSRSTSGHLAPIKPIAHSAVEPAPPVSSESLVEEAGSESSEPQPIDTDFAEELHQNIMEASKHRAQGVEMGSDAESHGSQPAHTSPDFAIENEAAQRLSRGSSMRNYLTGLSEHDMHDPDAGVTTTSVQQGGDTGVTTSSVQQGRDTTFSVQPQADSPDTEESGEISGPIHPSTGNDQPGEVLDEMEVDEEEEEVRIPNAGTTGAEVITSLPPELEAQKDLDIPQTVSRQEVASDSDDQEHVDGAAPPTVDQAIPSGSQIQQSREDLEDTPVQEERLDNREEHQEEEQDDAEEGNQEEESSDEEQELQLSRPVPAHGRGRGRGRGSRPRRPPRPATTVSMALTKSIFTHYCRKKVHKDAWPDIEKVTEDYWRAVSRDLSHYTNHAGRRTVKRADMELLMRRQNFITDKQSLTVLIEKYLPLEYRSLLIPIARSGGQLEPKV